MYTSSANVSERQAAPPSLAISTVIFALRPSEKSGRPTLWIPLVRRIREPFKGLWALPGGPLTHAESLQDAASRNLRETTGLAPSYLEQLYAFGGLHRSPTQRVVSIVYWALVQPTEAALADESENVRWFRADRLGELAFDHNAIVDYALWRLRNKLAYGSDRLPPAGRVLHPGPGPGSLRSRPGPRTGPRQLPPPDQVHAGDRRNRRVPAGRQTPPAPPLPLYRPPRP